jgi:hypothetical protein
VSSAELAYAYAVWGNAKLGRIPQSAVGGMGFDIDMEDERAVQRIALTDHPMNRAAIAVRDQFPEEKLMPLIARILAMSTMLNMPEAEAHIRLAPDGSGNEEMSEDFIDVAAVMPLNRKMAFNRSTFFKRVAAAHQDDD